MKKLLLASIVALGALTPMAAQDLYFQYEGNAVPAGGVVEFTKYEEYPYGKDKIEIFIQPEIFIVGNKLSPVSLKSTSNYPVQVCIGGQCEAAQEIIKDDLTIVPGKPENLLLDCSIYLPKDEELELPYIEVYLEAWYNDDPSNVVTMTLKMGDVNAAVHGIDAGLNAISFDGKSLHYDLNQASNISVYTLSGKQIINKQASGNGTVSLEGLSKGVYLYRVAGKNGKAIKAAKIIIK